MRREEKTVADVSVGNQAELIRHVIDRIDRDAAAESDVSRGTVNVGARLLDIRKARSLTLQDASRMTGVSASAFSKIERNELSPTISTMQRIADGLKIELVSLLTDEDSATPAITGRRSVSRAGDGSRHTTRTCKNTLLCTDLRNKRATPIFTTVTARSTDEYSAWAKSDAELFVMVLEGTLVVHSRLYEPVELNKGDSIYYDASSEHAWTSTGPQDAEVIWILMSA
jgi:ribosome-binding protein aMBF1 (putative translation factor)/quercetin dioxygenase-like cupin family protein